MQTGPSSLLLEFSNGLLALAAAGIYALCRPRNVSGQPFFSAQRWTMAQAVIFLFGLDLAYKAASPLLSMRGHLLGQLDPWIVFQFAGPLWAALFFLALRQPVRTAGLASPPLAGILYALRWLSGILLVVAVASIIAPAETLITVFRAKPDAAPESYFMRLLVAAACAGFIEEVAYRGILYGALRKRLAPIAAIVVTAACFMLAHGEVNPLAFGMGLLCGWMVEKYHSLLPGMIVHTGWDLASGINAWFVGAMNLDPHRYFQAVALLTGTVFVAVWIMGKRWTYTPPDQSCVSKE